MQEYITCSAVWVKDDKDWSCRSVKSGLVIPGRRHPDCLDFGRRLHPQWAEMRKQGKVIQGFLTSHGRFVDREEAAKIALAAKQIDEPRSRLYSEDIY